MLNLVTLSIGELHRCLYFWAAVSDLCFWGTSGQLGGQGWFFLMVLGWGSRARDDRTWVSAGKASTQQASGFISLTPVFVSLLASPAWHRTLSFATPHDFQWP